MNWRNDNKERSAVKIISNTDLDPATTAAITTAMMTFTATGKGTIPATATINLELRVNAQPVINLRKLLKLKHNRQ